MPVIVISVDVGKPEKQDSLPIKKYLTTLTEMTFNQIFGTNPPPSLKFASHYLYPSYKYITVESLHLFNDILLKFIIQWFYIKLW